MKDTIFTIYLVMVIWFFIYLGIIGFLAYRMFYAIKRPNIKKKNKGRTIRLCSRHAATNRFRIGILDSENCDICALGGKK